MQRTYKGTTIACYAGYFVQAIINNLSPILFIVFQEEFGISLAQIGSLILINFLSQTVVDLISVKVVDRIGYKKVILASHACATAGLILLGTLPRFVSAPFPALVLATVISAMGSGMIEVTISPIVDAIPSNKKEADMSLLHSFYCWGQMTVVALSTLFVWFAGNSYWYVLPLVWACVPFVNLLNFATLPFPKTLKEEEKIPLRKLFSERNFRIAMLLMLCAGASELAMSQWSSFFAETGLGVTKVMGDLLGPCLFAVFMGLGRLLFGIYGDRLDLKKLCSSALSCALSVIRPPQSRRIPCLRCSAARSRASRSVCFGPVHSVWFLRFIRMAGRQCSVCLRFWAILAAR